MTAIALGCSHTAGVGVDPDQCYVSMLSQLLGSPVLNLGVPGGNAGDVQNLLVEQLQNQSPEFVIAQWPNPLRLTMWHNQTAQRENIHNASVAFNHLLKQSAENFYQPWLRAIVTCDLLCRQAGIPVIHILLEDLAPRYMSMLNSHGICLHTDQKIPGATWLFDSAASDNLHHSAWCHAQWAERLIGLLNELTSR
jgi:hypothetical protein